MDRVCNNKFRMYRKSLPKYLCFVFLIILFLVYWNIILDGEYEQEYGGVNQTSVAIVTEAEKALKRRLPQVLIIGAMKCGTGALLNMMDIHPNLKAFPHELHFFDRDGKYNLGLEWYRKKMPRTSSDQIAVEKSPSYLVSSFVPKRVYKMNEFEKLILVVRDPAIRAISHYTHVLDIRRKKNITSILSFEEFVLTKNGSIYESCKAIVVGRYGEHLAKWLKFFPLQQILILNGGVLIKSPLEELIKVESFLNLPKYYSAWNFYFNETKNFYCFRNEIREECLPPVKGRVHPEVDNQTISKLRHYFAPFNERFYSLIGQRFDWPI